MSENLAEDIDNSVRHIETAYEVARNHTSNNHLQDRLRRDEPP
jgi:hypothetical protein